MYFPDDSEVPRGWRAVLLLAEAIKQELVEADINPHSMKDRQLKVEVEQRLRGGATLMFMYTYGCALITIFSSKYARAYGALFIDGPQWTRERDIWPKTGL